MSTFADYIETFRRYAIYHKDIRHNPASEDPDYSVNDDCHFATFSTDEVITKLRTTISDGVTLLVHPYSTQGGQNEPGTTFKSIHEAAFIIVKKADAFNFAEQNTAIDLCETITWDIIRRIHQESNGEGQSCSFMNMINLISFSSDAIYNIFDGRYGWYTKFTFTIRRTHFMDTVYAENDLQNPFSDPQIQQPG